MLQVLECTTAWREPSTLVVFSLRHHQEAEHKPSLGHRCQAGRREPEGLLSVGAVLPVMLGPLRAARHLSWRPTQCLSRLLGRPGGGGGIKEAHDCGSSCWRRWELHEVPGLATWHVAVATFSIWWEPTPSAPAGRWGPHQSPGHLQVPACNAPLVLPGDGANPRTTAPASWLCRAAVLEALWSSGISPQQARPSHSCILSCRQLALSELPCNSPAC